MTLELTARDQSMLDGEQGPSAAAAMKILVAFSKAIGARGLLDISGAHIDGCLYHGKAGLDFVERLVEGGGRVVDCGVGVRRIECEDVLVAR